MTTDLIMRVNVRTTTYTCTTVLMLQLRVDTLRHMNYKVPYKLAMESESRQSIKTQETQASPSSAEPRPRIRPF